MPVEIHFLAQFEGSDLICGTPGPIALTDLRFYVSAAELRRADGTFQSIELIENGRWQQSGLALIDLEDSRGPCRNGTSDSNAEIRGIVPDGDYTGLRFTVAVPFGKNHADPLAAEPPLDDSTMHWHWRSGYKYLRVGFTTVDDGFWMHVGSAGCEGTIQNITGCRFPNRVAVNLPEFRPGDRVVVDLSSLALAVNLDDGVATDCSSGPAEAACREPFAMLGINFDSGERMGDQTLFREASR